MLVRQEAMIFIRIVCLKSALEGFPPNLYGPYYKVYENWKHAG